MPIVVKNPPANAGDLGWEDPLEEGMATHSSILAWRIPMGRGAWWESEMAMQEKKAEILVVPREKTPTGAAARGNP